MIVIFKNLASQFHKSSIMYYLCNQKLFLFTQAIYILQKNRENFLFKSDSFVELLKDIVIIIKMCGSLVFDILNFMQQL